MSYEIIALDVDGTLTNSRKEITDRTRSALIEAQRQGKKVIVASGRHQFGLKDIAKELMLDKFGGYIMAFNGGRIIDASTGEVLSARLFPHESIKPVCDAVKDANITVITYEGDTIIMNDKVNDYTYIEKDVHKIEMVVVDDFLSSIKFDVNKILLAGEPDELDEYQKLLSKRYDGLLEIYKSAPYFLELMPFGISKGSMLPLLLEKLHISREELIAFGDNYNDMTMIGYAGMGVAMANGEPEIKKIANYVCPSNDEDGIAQALQKFVLK